VYEKGKQGDVMAFSSIFYFFKAPFTWQYPCSEICPICVFVWLSVQTVFSHLFHDRILFPLLDYLETPGNKKKDLPFILPERALKPALQMQRVFLVLHTLKSFRKQLTQECALSASS
jgi:hypothetical protein